MFQIQFKHIVQIDAYDSVDLLVGVIPKSLYNVIMLDDDRRDHIYSMTIGELTIRNNTESREWIRNCIANWQMQNR